MSLLALDPGTTHTGWVQFANEVVQASGIHDNHEILDLIRSHRGPVAIERFEARGMPIGDESVVTMLWTGRFIEAAGMDRVRLVKRSAVKSHLCGSQRAKDANVWQALVDRWGGKALAVGTIKRTGPLYGVKSHARAALAVAVTATETKP